MAKSKTQQLKEAIEAGDLEKAKALIDSMPEKAPRRPAKASAKTKRSKASGKSSKAARIDLNEKQENVPIKGAIYDQSDWLAPTNTNLGRSTRVGDDGTIRVAARHESMSGCGKGIRFEGTGVELTKAQKKVEQSLAEQPLTDRRPGTKKVTVRCEGCSGEFTVSPAELTLAHDNNYKPYRFYKCDRCIQRGR